MVPSPSNWDTLWEDPESVLELRIRVYVYGNEYLTYTNGNLASCKLQGSLFNDLSIGNACSACLRLKMKDAAQDAKAFKKYMQITFACRLRKGSATSNYASQGTYYIDTITINDDDSVDITAYDFMFMFERQRVYDEHRPVSFSTGFTFFGTLRSMYGGTCDYYSFVETGFLKSPYLSSQAYKISGLQIIWEYLSNTREAVASMAMWAGGNAAIDKSTVLRLYRLDRGPSITTAPLGIVVTASSLSKDERPQVITGVDLSLNDKTIESGSGWRIEAKYTDNVLRLYNASTTPPSIESLKDQVVKVAANMHSGIDDTYPEAVSLRVSDVHADGVYITPLFELGDIASVDIGNGQYYNFMICEYNVNYDGGCWGSIGVTKSEQSVRDSIDETWADSSSWDSDWGQKTIPNSNFIIDILGKNVFRLKPDELYIVGTDIRESNMIKVSEGLRPLTATITYISTADGVSRSLDVTGYLIDTYFPRESNTGSSSFISNLLFYSSTTFPDDAIGAQVTSTFPIRDITSSQPVNKARVLGSNN